MKVWGTVPAYSFQCGNAGDSGHRSTFGFVVTQLWALTNPNSRDTGSIPPMRRGVINRKASEKPSRLLDSSCDERTNETTINCSFVKAPQVRANVNVIYLVVVVIAAASSKRSVVHWCSRFILFDAFTTIPHPVICVTLMLRRRTVDRIVWVVKKLTKLFFFYLRWSEKLCYSEVTM